MSSLWMFLILGGVVAVLTNAWRHGNIDLTGKDANMRGVYARSITIGVALCLLLRVNFIAVVRNPDVAIGWLANPWDPNAGLLEQVGFVFEEIVGIAAAGVALAFIAKFLNDTFDILYEFKRWLRGTANATKPEPSTRSRTATTRRTRPPRSPRRRGGGGGGGGEPNDMNRDSRDMRGPRD